MLTTSTTRLLSRRRVVHVTRQPAIFASATTTRLLGAQSCRRVLQLRPLSSSAPSIASSSGTSDERDQPRQGGHQDHPIRDVRESEHGALQGVLGVVSHSSALIADAAHSMSDLLSDFVTLWSVKVARLPPDPNHPYGYGKYEAVGSLSVGAILVVCGAGIGLDGLHALQAIWADAGAASTALPELSLPFLPDLDRNMQLGLAAGAAGLSIAAKEALYHATVRIGERAKSKVLIANAWHHRTDAISSVVALGGILGSMAGIPLLDPAAGMAVSAMIVKTGVDICLDSVRELTDKSVEADVLELLNEVSRNVDDVLLVSNIRARRMGPYTLVDLRVHVHARTSISMAQQVAARVRSHILRQLPDVSEVLVHVDVEFDLEDRSRVSAKQLLEQEMRPYREIKRDVTYALAKILRLWARRTSTRTGCRIAMEMAPSLTSRSSFNRI
ncbi:hypothetical protein PINS_up015088 [Pythium insidiosum]|nr:hypothetical protein PINS_up015088 [Pythium insidiosum]